MEDANKVFDEIRDRDVIFSMVFSPTEALRESKREMATATRGIEREIGSLQLEEKKLVAEIKRTAKTGNEAATKVLARQLIRFRQQIANLQGSRAQMRGVATHTQAMHAHSSVAVGMKGATKAMAAMNKSNTNEIRLLKFPELRSLTLLSLPELIGFYPILSIEGNASELFHEKVEVSKLERMVLSSIQIGKIWSDQSWQCFRNLIHLDVNGCCNLKYLISFSMATSLVYLQSLFVSECVKNDKHISARARESC